MYDRYYSSCQGGAYKPGWPEDDRDDGLRFIKKNIAVNHHSILFKVTEERNSFFILAHNEQPKWEHILRFPASAHAQHLSSTAKRLDYDFNEQISNGGQGRHPRLPCGGLLEFPCAGGRLLGLKCTFCPLGPERSEPRALWKESKCERTKSETSIFP